MRVIVTALLSLAFILGCGSPAAKRREAARPTRIPAAVVAEREITVPVAGMPLRTPTEIVTDYRGDSYLCDQGNNRIIKFNRDLLPIGERGGYGSQPGLFNQPSAITVDNRLNLWVCDAGNRRLVRLDAELNFVDEVPFIDTDDPMKYGVPSGIGATTFGELWVSDIERDRVAVFDNVGQFQKFVGDFGSSGGAVRDPRTIVVDNDELFYVCDPGNSRVAVYDSYGSEIRSLADDALAQPIAASLDRRRQLWVLDGAGSRLFCFDAEGDNLAEGGLDLVGRATVESPSGLSMISDSVAVISDAATGRLVVCKLIFK